MKQERESLLREGGVNLVYIAEAQDADKAGMGMAEQGRASIV